MYKHCGTAASPIFTLYIYIYIYIYIYATTDTCFDVLTSHQCSSAYNNYRQLGVNLRLTPCQSSSQPLRPSAAITFRSRILTVINIHTISVFFGLKLASYIYIYIYIYTPHSLRDGLSSLVVINFLIAVNCYNAKRHCLFVCK